MPVPVPLLRLALVLPGFPVPLRLMPPVLVLPLLLPPLVLALLGPSLPVPPWLPPLPVPPWLVPHLLVSHLVVPHLLVPHLLVPHLVQLLQPVRHWHDLQALLPCLGPPQPASLPSHPQPYPLLRPLQALLQPWHFPQPAPPQPLPLLLAPVQCCRHPPWPILCLPWFPLRGLHPPLLLSHYLLPLLRFSHPAPPPKHPQQSQPHPRSPQHPVLRPQLPELRLAPLPHPVPVPFQHHLHPPRPLVLLHLQFPLVLPVQALSPQHLAVLEHQLLQTYTMPARLVHQCHRSASHMMSQLPHHP
mmetsp:Transcript_75470/g.126951  ORF Transcript_75470/g.126951 Transcript_75470/m.126951 type:complete len:301 (-) Transcript_75470:244-1146(-)